MNTSQNGFQVLSREQCEVWKIPVRRGESRHYALAPGAKGFVLAHCILWWHEVIEPINEGVWDEWGWADRPIRSSEETSNHASGTAADVNAVRHPLGAVNTFRYNWQKVKIVTRLKFFYHNRIRWGGSYHNRKDEMHLELEPGPLPIYRLAKRLEVTPRGKRILAINKHYRP